MAVQTFVPDKPTTAGKVPTKHEGLSAADTFRFLNNGRVALRVTAGSTEAKLKVVIQEKVDGVTPAPREIVLKENTHLIGPFEESEYNNEEGYVEFTLSATT